MKGVRMKKPDLHRLRNQGCPQDTLSISPPQKLLQGGMACFSLWIVSAGCVPSSHFSILATFSRKGLIRRTSFAFVFHVFRTESESNHRYLIVAVPSAKVWAEDVLLCLAIPESCFEGFCERGRAKAFEFEQIKITLSITVRTCSYRMQ